MIIPSLNQRYREAGFQLDTGPVDTGEGGWLALIGPNGSGKSTFGRVLAEQAERGTWLYMPQQPEDFLFAENLEEQLGLLGGKHLDPAGLRHHLDGLGFSDPDQTLKQPMPFFSGGEQRLLILALALTLDPPALVLDEPTIGLTGKEKVVILDNLDTFLNRGHEVLTITHDPELLEHADWVLALQEGRMSFSGPRSEFLEKEGRTLDKHGVRSLGSQ